MIAATTMDNAIIEHASMNIMAVFVRFPVHSFLDSLGIIRLQIGFSAAYRPRLLAVVVHARKWK